MTELPARSGTALRLTEGQELLIRNTHGKQVVDTWAFADGNPNRHLSAAHTWMALGRFFVGERDVLVDNVRSPMLQLVEDSSEGHHDLLIPSCDIHRYRQLGVEGYHDNCADNFAESVTALGYSAPAATPQPFNAFMHVPVRADGTFAIAEPTARPGDVIRLRALQDVVVVMSACPQDLAATNGSGREPSGVTFDVLG